MAGETLPEQLVPVSTPLPDVRVALSPQAINERLLSIAKKGELAGYSPGGPSGAMFTADAFGKPFDRTLVAHSRPDGGETVLVFTSRLRPRVPVIFAVTIVLTIWPGVWLTDSMLGIYFGWYRLSFAQTCLWYLPLTVLPLPWAMLKMWRTSQAVAHDSAHRAIAKIAKALGAA